MFLDYIGGELKLFSKAKNWKSYYGKLIAPHLGHSVLEVGAGIGSNTQVLCHSSHYRWVCLEPDQEMITQMHKAQAIGRIPPQCEIHQGVLSDFKPVPEHDSILYIDVIEHIKKDAAELHQAAKYLKPKGKIIVLSPAHPFLFSDFDRSIGHFRRYTRKSLLALSPPGFRTVRAIYLDSVGLLASLFNRLIMKKNMPSEMDIWIWDRLMVRMSRFVDPKTGYILGKSLLVIFENYSGKQQ